MNNWLSDPSSRFKENTVHCKLSSFLFVYWLQLKSGDVQTFTTTVSYYNEWWRKKLLWGPIKTKGLENVEKCWMSPDSTPEWVKVNTNCVEWVLSDGRWEDQRESSHFF